MSTDRPSCTLSQLTPFLLADVLKSPDVDVSAHTDSGSDSPAPAPRRLAPLTRENLSDVSTDTTDTDTDLEDNRFVQEEEDIQRRRNGRKPNRRLSHDQHLRQAVVDWSSDSEDEMRRGGLARLPRGAEDGKEDWAALSDDPDVEPEMVRSPYYKSSRR